MPQINKNILLFIFSLLMFSCKKNEYEYDWYKEYPVMEVGDYWIDKFDQRGLQNAKVYKDFLFVNTINISEGQEYLYCLNLKSGKVQWKNKVNAYASQSVEIVNSKVLFVTYVGDIYAFSLSGNKIWQTKLKSSYGGHQINSKTKNLLVRTVTQGNYEFDVETGKELLRSDEKAWKLNLLKNAKIDESLNHSKKTFKVVKNKEVYQIIIYRDVQRNNETIVEVKNYR